MKSSMAGRGEGLASLKLALVCCCVIPKGRNKRYASWVGRAITQGQPRPLYMRIDYLLYALLMDERWVSAVTLNRSSSAAEVLVNGA